MLRRLLGLIGYVGLFAAALFIPAGTIHWRAAWILLGVLFTVRATSAVLLQRAQPGLLAERARFPIQRGQIVADRVLLLASMASFAAVIVFASVDRWHLHLLADPPRSLRAAGLAAFGAGWWIVHLALTANAFAVTVVRYQAERGHVVADRGPYRFVRHPFYAGLPFVLVGLALWLGSFAAAVASAVPLGILVIRIIHEERMLRARLDGYAAYAARVRWRVVPGIW